MGRDPCSQNQITELIPGTHGVEGEKETRRETIPTDLKAALEKIHQRKFEFGKEFIIPSPFDTRLKHFVSNAVAQAAIDSGVARIKSL